MAEAAQRASKRTRCHTLADVAEVTGQDEAMLKDMLRAKRSAKEEDGEDECEIDDSFADYGDIGSKIEELTQELGALGRRVTRTETILHEVCSDVYRNTIRLIANPPRMNPKQFKDGLEPIMKGLYGLQNVARVRAGLRHVDLDMGIMFDAKQEADVIKNHLRDKHIDRLRMGPMNNPETSSATRYCYNAYTNVFWYFSDDQDNKLPPEAVIDTRSGFDPDKQQNVFSLALKETGEVIINGTFNKESLVVKVNVLETMSVKGIKLEGKDITEEMARVWWDKTWTLKARTVTLSARGLQQAPEKGKGKGKADKGDNFVKGKGGKKGGMKEQ